MATLTGTAGADWLQGTEGADSLSGLGGDDTLVGGAGGDTLDGGAGNDRAVIDRSAGTAAISVYMLAPWLVSQVAGTSVTGVEHLSFASGGGNDGLVGAAGDDSLAGGAGNDALQGLAGADTLLGGDGADTLLGGAGADLLTGGAGADRFILQGSGGLDSSLAAPDRIADFNAAEGDLLVLRGEAIGTGLLPLATGSFGLSGGASLPVGFGGALAARVAPATGMALPDATGGQGLTLYWQPGLSGGGWLLLDLDRDGLLGTADLVLRFDLPAGQAIGAGSFVAGTFSILGTGGADSLAGAAGAERILGFAGADVLAGLDGDDTLIGGEGNDSLAGGAGFDSLVGGEGDDQLDGGAGTDLLDGGNGNDAMAGGAGDDLLLGAAGDDWLQGGDGDDSLQGGFGADRLEGAAGADTLLLQGMGQAGWSGLGAMDTVIGFSRAEGDRLRLSNAWLGRADGSGADAGTYTGADGIARPLVFSGSTGTSIAAPAAGMALPAQRLDAYQAYWLPGQDGGGWLVLDLDRNGRLDATDLTVRLDGVGSLGVADFVDGTFLTLDGGYVIGGTTGNDSLQGGSLAETFLGSLGNDRIAGGAGAGNALSYDGLGGPVAVTFAGTAAGTVLKPGGGVDRFTGIQVIAGTAGADTVDAGGAAAGFFALSLEGRAGADRIIGNGTTAVQASYGTSPAAAFVDLQGGTAQDGWGSIDTLVDIRRVAALSAQGDTVMGSAWDDVFLSGQSGNKSFDGRAGQDEWRYAGGGSITVMLTTTTVGGFVQGPYVLKPGGTDRLTSIEIVTAGAGNDSIHGSAADERFSGGAGNDTIDGGGGLDTVSYDAGGLATQGVTVNLSAGTGTDQWGGADVLRGITSVWGSALGDDLTGVIIGTYTWMRGLAGNDTLRAPWSGSWAGADYAGDPAGIDADLGAGRVRDGWGGTDRLIAISLIRGSAFDDSIAGGTGTDTLIGGAGNDTYRVGPGDQVVEAPGEGSDTIIATQAWALPAHVEALVLAEAAGNANGWGNALDNLLAGNGGANLLDGGAGQDTLTGGDGADTLHGSGGDDVLTGEAGQDVLVGGQGADRLFGGDGADIIISEADGRSTGTLLLDAGEVAPRVIALADIGTTADHMDGGGGYDRWGAGSIGMLLDLRALPGAMLGMEDFSGSSGSDVLLLAAGQQAATVNGGAGDDTLSGTGSGDWIYGSDGNDLVAGQGGGDSLYGVAGADTVIGGAGMDLIDGGDGDDLLIGGDGSDTLYGGLGADTVQGGAGGDWLEGGDGADSLEAGDDADTLYGGADADTLLGGNGADRLDGGEDNDLLDGSDGADALYGGIGADTMSGGAGTDWLSGGDGSDSLGGGDGGDTLLGEAGDDVLQGDADADWLGGGDGKDLLNGGDGGDTLAGGAGADRLFGEAGMDSLDGGDGNDLLDGGDDGDTLHGGFGADTLQGGAGADSLDGNDNDDLLDGGDGADTLLGGAGDDTLQGGDGNDRLDGQAGRNSLEGGPGDDTLVSAGWDALLDGGDGNDLALIDRSTVGVGLVLDMVAGSLTDGLHTTLLRGIERLDVAGGAGADRLAGGDGPDRLAGGDGKDTLTGGGGDDTLIGGAGADQLHGMGGCNSLDGGLGDDTLVSVDWDAVLDGGDGNDLARIDRSASLVGLVLGAGDVTDGSRTTLLRGIERLDVTGGAAADRLTGDAGADSLTGGAGDDTLDGGAGADRLAGGLGHDLYHVGNAGDRVVEAPGEGRDTVIAGIDHALAANVEVLVLAAGALRGTGNELANLILGNDGPNILIGGAGDDTLVGGGGMDRLLGGDGDDGLDGASGLGEMDWLAGGAGNDAYRVDSAADVVVEAPGGGIDTILADIPGSSYVLPADVENLVLLGTARIGQGNALDNVITGNAAANWLMGGAGQDRLDGGGGNDALFGGAGADLFLFGPGGGADRIGDFTPGLDHIRLTGLAGFAAVLAAAADRPGGVVIDLGHGDSLTPDPGHTANPDRRVPRPGQRFRSEH